MAAPSPPMLPSGNVGLRPAHMGTAQATLSLEALHPLILLLEPASSLSP